MTNQKSGFRWVVLLLLFLNIFFCMVTINVIPPVFSEIVKEIPLNKAQMGMVMGFVTLASLIFAPLGGGLGDKIGSRWVVTGAAVIVTAAGALRYYANSAGVLMLCMFFLGAGFAMMLAVMPKSLSMWFPPQDLAKANGICFSALGLGSAVGMGITPGILVPAFNGWRGTTVALACVCLAVGILWSLIYRDRQVPGQQPDHDVDILNNFKRILKIKDIWLISLYYGFIMIALMSVIALLPISLAEKGLPKAAEYASIMLGVSVIFNVVGGILSDKTGKRKPYLIVCALILAVCIPFFILFTGVPLILALVVAGIVLGPTAPIVMTVPVEVKEVGTALAGSALGFILMIGNTGSFVGPVISGILMDVTGAAWTGFVFMAAVVACAALVVIPLGKD